MIQIQHYESPCGELILGSFEGKLCLCDWMFEKRRASIDKRIQKALGADYEEGVSDVIRKQSSSLTNILLVRGKRLIFRSSLRERSSRIRCGRSCWIYHTAKRCLMASWLKSWETRKLFVPWLQLMVRILFRFLFLVIG